MLKNTLFAFLISIPVSYVWAGPVDQPIDSILKDYFKIQSALAQDTMSGVDEAASSIVRTASAIDSSDAEIRNVVEQIETSAQKIQGRDLEAARTQFFELSRPLLVYLNKFHSNKDQYFRYFCPMAKKGWIQSEKGTKNPYYGSSMLTCGELIK